MAQQPFGKRMKILVTGGAGVIGRRVVRELLARGHVVRVFDSAATEAAEMMLEDMADPVAVDRAVEGCEAVAHLAAIISPLKVPERIHPVNVLGTRHLLDAAEKHGVKRVVLASTCAVYGMSFEPRSLPCRLPIDEEHPLRARDPYGLSKIENERDAEAWSRRTGGASVCLRLATVIDFEQPLKWLHDFSPHSPSFWSYVDIRDAARAFVVALESESRGHLAVQIAGEGVFCRADPRRLVRKRAPELERYLDEYDYKERGFWDAGRAARELGFVPQYSWRQAVSTSPPNIWRVLAGQKGRRVIGRFSRLIKRSAG